MVHGKIASGQRLDVGIRWITALVAGVCLAQPVLAATPGSNGPTSTGSLDITLTANLSARLTGLTDMLLGTWAGAGDMSADENICVGRNGVGFFATGNYRIRASGDGDSFDVNAFTLTNGVDTVYYDVYFNDQPNLAGRQQVTGGVTLNGQTSIGFAHLFNFLFGCTIRNANVSIVVPEAGLVGTSSGNYAGTLTLVLIPD